MSDRYSRRRGAFTLMEVLLVLVILVIMASLAVSVFRGTQRSAYIKVAQVQVDTLSQDCERFRTDMNAYPTSLQDLRTRPGATGADNWAGPYSDKDVGPDPWGNAYQYDPNGQQHNGERPDIWSGGPPGENHPIYNQ